MGNIHSQMKICSFRLVIRLEVRFTVSLFVFFLCRVRFLNGIQDPGELEKNINLIPGVVDNGKEKSDALRFSHFVHYHENTALHDSELDRCIVFLRNCFGCRDHRDCSCKKR